jgi:tetratricopeptide (TPR) repeat protein
MLGAGMLGPGSRGEAAAQAPARTPVTPPAPSTPVSPAPSAPALPAPASPASASPAPAARQLQVAFDLAYNLDHDQALAALDQAMRDHPNDAALPRAHATLTWLNLLFRRGMVLVENYLGPVSKEDVKVATAPTPASRAFHTQVGRSIALSEAALKRNPNDPDAMFELGSALGLQASWAATIDGKVMGAFGSARRAYNLHERVLAVAPHRVEAGLIVGTYRYLVASLMLPARWLAYVAGFGGGKEKGLGLIEAVANSTTLSRTDARFALVLLYNREGRYGPAQTQLGELRRAYPRNRLLWLESGATHLRAGKPAEAEAALTEGMRMLAADTRVRMLGEEGHWRYERGMARVRLRRAADAIADLTDALKYEQLGWVRTRTHLELGKAADLAGDRQRALAEYTRAQQSATTSGDTEAASQARRYKESPYRGT